MRMENSTQEVLSPLACFAIQAHEMFDQFIKAGFNEQQALVLVIGFSGRSE